MKAKICLISSLAIATTVVGSGTLRPRPLPVQAVQFANGTVAFDSVPLLRKAATTISSTYSFGATYYFEIELPANAGEPLKQLEIQQQEGFDLVRFNLDRTRVALDKRQGTAVPLESVTVDPDNRLTVMFAKAIAPGNKVFLALRPRMNPDTSGVYLFGVTARPEGDRSQPQFIGYGRLQFYDSGGFL